MIESFQYANSVKTVSNNTDWPDAQTEQLWSEFWPPAYFEEKICYGRAYKGRITKNAKNIGRLISHVVDFDGQQVLTTLESWDLKASY